MTHILKPTLKQSTQPAATRGKDHMAAKSALFLSMPTLICAYVIFAAVIVMSTWWVLSALFGSTVSLRELIHDPSVIGVVELIILAIAAVILLVAWLKRKWILNRLA